MKDIKSINRKFLLSIISIIVTIALVLVIFGLILWWVSYNTTLVGLQYALLFAMMIVFIFVATYYRTRFERLINTSYMVKIRANEGEPLDINRAISYKAFHAYMMHHDYTLFAKDTKHYLYYRTVVDPVKKVFKRKVLEFVVYVNKIEDEFYLEVVDEEIRKVQDKLHDSKTKFDKMLITQIKEIDELDQTTRDRIKEVIFLRSQNSILSTINVGLLHSANKAIMLYSDTYSPSLYYKYHIDQIKKMI